MKKTGLTVAGIHEIQVTSDKLARPCNHFYHKRKTGGEDYEDIGKDYSCSGDYGP